MTEWKQFRYKTKEDDPILRWYLERLRLQGFVRNVSIKPVRTFIEVSYEQRNGPSPIICLMECGYLPPAPDYPLEGRKDPD